MVAPAGQRQAGWRADQARHSGDRTRRLGPVASDRGSARPLTPRLRSQVADEQSRQAEAANRVKDEFLATLSHELRTPLNSVLGWSRLLASGKLDGEQTRRAIQAIERAGWAQSRLIEDLLDLSRIVSDLRWLTNSRDRPRPRTA